MAGGLGNDTLDGGPGADEINARDGEKDTIVVRSGEGDVVYYDRGLDVLEGCPENAVELPPTESPFEAGTKVLVEHKGKKELCLPEAALNGHLKHGDEVLSWEGCSDTEGGRKGLR